MKNGLNNLYQVALSHRTLILSVPLLLYAATLPSSLIGELITNFVVGIICESVRQNLLSRTKYEPNPPINAEFLFYLFLAPQACDALVGDLEERYRTIHKKFGKGRADFWYWKQMICSIGPIVWAWGMKVLKKPVIFMIGWAVTSGLIRHDSWLAVVVDVWRRIRS